MEDKSIKIKEFIKKRFAGGLSQEINNSDSLFEKGIIDSLGLLELIAFIEKAFKVSINMNEIMAENFDSIDKITQLIKRKTKH